MGSTIVLGSVNGDPLNKRLRTTNLVCFFPKFIPCFEVKCSLNCFSLSNKRYSLKTVFQTQVFDSGKTIVVE